MRSLGLSLGGKLETSSGRAIGLPVLVAVALGSSKPMQMGSQGSYMIKMMIKAIISAEFKKQ